MNLAQIGLCFFALILYSNRKGDKMNILPKHNTSPEVTEQG